MAEFGCKLGRSTWGIKYAPGQSCQCPRFRQSWGSKAVIVAACRTTWRLGAPEYAPAYGGRKCQPVRTARSRQGSSAEPSSRTMKERRALFSIGGGPFATTAGFSPSLWSGIRVVLLLEGLVDQLSTSTEGTRCGLGGSIMRFDQRLPSLEMCKSRGSGRNTYYPGCRLLLNKPQSLNQTLVLGWRRRDCLTSLLGTSQQQPRSICTLLSANELRTNVSLRLWVGLASASRNSCSSAMPLHRSKTAYYGILQVSPSATQAQIKTAYYKQSFIYHPDRNGGSEAAAERFTEIVEAYSVLGSIALRRKYDRGILTRADVHGSGTSSAEETPAAGAATQPRGKARRSSVTEAGRKPVFDFDAFYRAHYGEQLQREREIRWRKEQLQRRQKEGFKKWKLGKLTELSVAVLLALGMGIILSIRTGY